MVGKSYTPCSRFCSQNRKTKKEYRKKSKICIFNIPLIRNAGDCFSHDRSWPCNHQPGSNEAATSIPLISGQSRENSGMEEGYLMPRPRHTLSGRSALADTGKSFSAGDGEGRGARATMQLHAPTANRNQYQQLTPTYPPHCAPCRPWSGRGRRGCRA